ncbi:ectodysplasin-A-like isoform X6 [Asterias rubens]|uniref:ectodysplasin-A-like isoform X6 n=1 Tax=Asterias rubens TaxID=7604 RepID=UPI0014552291|nr:ectodysplasin-A-like isoform X6 [Asterias rubens]
MQEQRSWQLGLVVACLVSCGLVGMIVIVNQSSSEISSLHSVLRAQESRISILEIQNRNLHLVLENIQWKLNKKEHNPMKTDGDHVARRLSTSDLPPNSVNQGALDAEVFGDRKAKGDDGAFIEGDRVTEEKARSEEKDDFHLRTFRSTRNQRDKGKKGEPGRTSFGGEKGAKGERGHRGPPGECEHSTTTDSTTPRQGTQGAGQLVWPALLAAHFEGGRYATINTSERWDPINRGYVDLSDFDGGWVPYWKYADWMDSDVRSRFILGQTGNVTVTEGGIYYVYSQMLYYDPSVFMGHSLYIGEQKRFSCTECTVDRDRKFNTCYIGGVVQINNGDKVGIRVSYANRVINLHPDSTHFGLIKLS